MQPNFEGSNPSNTKKYLSNFEYNLLNSHVEYSDQHMGAVHPSLSNIDLKFMKVCTIIIINRIQDSSYMYILY